jgi:hypothetical protein
VLDPLTPKLLRPEAHYELVGEFSEVEELRQRVDEVGLHAPKILTMSQVVRTPSCRT